MDSVTYGSVCSGIEAASVAWHSMGWRAAWLAEIESFPSDVLAHHYPAVPNLGDMTKIAAMVRSGVVAAPDVLVGGTPCQAFSIAGLRNSLDDARGQLSLSFVDLANAIDTARIIRGEPAAAVLWENVPGVLSTADNAFGCFLGALSGEDDPVVPPGKKWANAGCVFGPQRTVAWRVLDAQYFGVAQRRRRVFVIASARDGFDPAAVLFERDGLRRDFAPSRQAGQDVAGSLGARASSGGGFGADFECAGGLQPVLAYGGNNQGGAIDIAIARNACASASGRMDFESETFIVQPAYAIQAGALRTNPNSGPDGVGVQPHIAYTLEARAEVQAIAFDSRQDCVSSRHVFGALGSSSPQAQAVCVTGDITHTLKAEGFDGSEGGTGRGNPIVSVAFVQNSRDEVRLMGGDGQIVGALAAQPGMKQTCYVATVPSATAFATEQTPKFNEDCALTLTKQSPTGGGQIQSVMQGMAVRRLIPKECARLQGFPDFYLSSVLRKGKPPADGPMYKAFGNSMAVPCMAFLGSRIDAAIRGQA